VVLLERESQPATQATGRSAAMFMESYGSPQGRALTRASRALYQAPALVPILSPRGALYVAWAGQRAQLEQLAGPGLQLLSAEAALQKVPVLRREGLIGALLEPEAMDIDVHALLQGELSRARARGAQLWLNAGLMAGERAHGCAGWRLQLADGRHLHARVLVNAAGAWADSVAQACGLPTLGLVPMRRSAFCFAAPAGHDSRRWPAVCGVGGSWYFRPDAGQMLGSPGNADATAPQDVVPEALDIAQGIADIEQHTELQIRRPHRSWAGLRTFAPDGEMVVGYDPTAEGFFWLAGQGGWGLQSAGATAMLAEALITDSALPEALLREGVDVAALSPQRLNAAGG
jgi:D-arginine dehydrogenase